MSRFELTQILVKPGISVRNGRCFSFVGAEMLLFLYLIFEEVRFLGNGW